MEGERLYRCSKPRIRECMDEHTGRRSTGNYGCGLYAYEHIEPAKAQARGDKEKCYIIPIKGAKLYKPYHIGQLADFSSAMTIVAYDDDPNWSKELFDHIKNVERKYKAEKDKDRQAERRYQAYHDVDMERFGLGGFDSSGIHIINAIQKSKECIAKKREGLSPWEWAMYCSPPINHLLYDQGFDGIMPLGEAADWNSAGVVVFKEFLEKKFGKELKAHENFEYGEELKEGK